jgi:hypothetical protein
MVSSWSAIKLLQKRVSCGRVGEIGGKLPEQHSLSDRLVYTLCTILVHIRWSQVQVGPLSTPPFKSKCWGSKCLGGVLCYLTKCM